MKLAVGQRLASTVCDAEVIVLRVGSPDADLRCGGAELVDPGDAAAHGGGLDEAAHGGGLDEADGGGTLLGKRYVDAGGTLEILCTKAGQGELTLDGAPLMVKAPKTLPSSD